MRFHLKALHNSVEGVPDIIHAHCAYPDGRTAIEYGLQTGRPVVITVHGSDVKILPKLKSQWRELIAETLTQAAAVIAVSQELRREVVQLGVPADKVRCIPNGVDCSSFRRLGRTSPVKMDGVCCMWADLSRQRDCASCWRHWLQCAVRAATSR